MNVWFRKDRIEVSFDESEYETSDYTDLINYLGKKHPPCLFYGGIGSLTYPFSLSLVITIPKVGNPSWEYRWVADESDRITAKEEWIRGELQD